MSIQVDLKHGKLNGTNVSLCFKNMFAQVQVFQDGNFVGKETSGKKFFAKHKYKYHVVGGDGEIVVIELVTSSFYDLIPSVRVDGESITVVPKLKWYQVFFIMIPFVFIVAGGAWGGLAGGGGFYVNRWIMRSGMKGVGKYIAALGGCFMTGVLYILLASAFVTVMHMNGVDVDKYMK
ncbi:hypothetical protein [Chromobacterium haemolyticum]|uniref:hypothetical protein n=1 Tax=Chromobacterium haemolyticum TaxID=394935 RepID=UPI0013199A36|nr:hypothetical protein [Chromobacterium haemolyticum]BBH12264.1 hypothetical protein CH06BL_15120 [Chromobacterium haemolyticum]